jgi:hemerythrin-like domain-containing protein
VSEDVSSRGISMLMAIHGAVRRDMDRLMTSVASLGDAAITVPDRRVGAAGLAAYWSCFAQQLHHHHTVEDVEVFPYLRQSLSGRGAAVLDAMGTEHDAIDHAQASVQEALDAVLADPTSDLARQLRDRLATFREVVTSHLAHEEETVVPLILAGFDDEYWMAFMSRRQQDPGAESFLPWVLDGAPQPAVEEVTGALPPPVRALLIEQWKPAHDSRVAALPG